MASGSPAADLMSLEVDEDGIAVLTMTGDGDQAWPTKKEEHRFTPAFIDLFNENVSKIEADPKVKALVIAGKGKFFSNGVDMAYIDSTKGVAREAGNNQIQASTTEHPVWGNTEKLMARILTLSLPTAAAVNGHWVAFGCMLGLACDYRVVNQDKGLMFVPAVDIAGPGGPKGQRGGYGPGMTNLMMAKVPQRVIRDMMPYARRFTGKELKEMGLAEATCEEGKLVATAKDLVRPWLAKGRKKDGSLSTMGGIKKAMYKQAFDALNAGRDEAKLAKL